MSNFQKEELSMKLTLYIYKSVEAFYSRHQPLTRGHITRDKKWSRIANVFENTE